MQRFRPPLGKASKARERAKARAAQRQVEQYSANREALFRNIYLAIEAGLFETSVLGRISQDTLRELEDLGYSVVLNDNCGGTTKVFW